MNRFLAMAVVVAAAIVCVLPCDSFAQGSSGSGRAARYTVLRRAPVQTALENTTQRWRDRREARRSSRVRAYGCNGSQGATISYVYEVPLCFTPVQTIKSTPAAECPNGICPTPTANWTWDGNTVESLKRHIQSDPHYHGADIANLPAQTLIALHSSEHELHATRTGDYSSYYPNSGKPFYGRIALAKAKPKAVAVESWL